MTESPIAYGAFSHKIDHVTFFLGIGRGGAVRIFSQTMTE